MSCNHCTTKFNFFHKEIGCSNCGLSFCSKCLKQKCKVPNKGTAEFNVCRVCYQKLTLGSSASGSTVITPPDAYLKRLDTMENQHLPLTTIHYDSKRQEAKPSLGTQDMQLLQRLERLKDDGKGPPPSENEIRQRLAKLKGDRQDKAQNAYVVGPSKPPGDALLEQFLVERDIELATNPQEEIEARLASLRGQGIRPNEGPFIQNLHDSPSSSEDEVEWITKKIMDEVALDTRCPVSLNTDASDDTSLQRNDSPELPWCVLCNNDAAVRCIDCGGDLYCTECNREAHKNWGETDHKVIPYR